MLRQLWRNLLGGLRMSLFLRVTPGRFRATAPDLSLLALTDLLLNVAVSLLLVGKRGVFAPSAIEVFFFHLPLLLLFGYLAGRLVSSPGLLTTIPVALVSLSISVELCHAAFEGLSQLSHFGWLVDYLEAPHYYRFFWWWSTASFVFLLRAVKPAPAPRRSAVLVLFVLLVVIPLWYFPRSDLWVTQHEGPESGELHLTEEVLAAQTRLLNGQLAGLLPGARGESNLYFVGFAGDGTQDVFLKELTATEHLFESRFGTAGRTIILANNPKTAATLPFATVDNLERALVRVGQVMNRDRDILFLYLTSHGSKDHELWVNNQPLELKTLTPARLQQILKQSGIKWKVVVVSACYSGGFVDPLKDARTAIITAADAGHESFGCGAGENFTWFGEAFVNDALRETFSFTGAFEKARDTIKKWEDEQGEMPSNPQMYVGKEIAPRLDALENELEQEEE